MVRESGVFRQVSPADLPAVAEALLPLIGGVRVWLFYGDLGAGKTTLIKVLGEAMGVIDPMSSPSFAIVNEYRTRSGRPLYHFDFYRIRREEEAFDLGVDEYFYSGDPCFVEWPEKIPSFIPAAYGKVSITFEDESKRTIAISVHDGKEENRV